MGPSATLPAQPAPRGVPVAVCTAPAGIPVLPHIPSSVRADATTPAETGQCSCRSLPGQSAAFPSNPQGRLPQSRIFEACSTFTHVSARTFAEPPKAALSRVLQYMSLPPCTALDATGWSDSCRTGFAPVRNMRLSTAHGFAPARKTRLPTAHDRLPLPVLGPAHIPDSFSPFGCSPFAARSGSSSVNPVDLLRRR